MATGGNFEIHPIDHAQLIFETALQNWDGLLCLIILYVIIKKLLGLVG
jgi:hypothetical protein